jgi:hypothetical protein
LEGWARNVDAVYKKEKKRLSKLLDYLELKTELSGLSFEDMEALLVT